MKMPSSEHDLDGCLLAGAELGTVGGALLHLLQLVQCNMQRITYVQNPTEFEDLKVATIGMGTCACACSEKV